MIYVVATIELVEGRRADFLEEFGRIVPQVRGERGCLEYGPAVDVATGIPAQESVRENGVTVIEKWESLESLEAHLQAPHMLEYRGRVKDLVAGVSLQVLEPA